MYLFIDTISETSYILLYDANRAILDTRTWTEEHSEFENINSKIKQLLVTNSLVYSDIKGATIIHGPWGFTGTRITSLVANSLLHFADIPLQGITYFELLTIEQVPYPHYVIINKREYLQCFEKKSLPTIHSQKDSPLSQGSGNAAPIDFCPKTGTISIERNYPNILKNLPHNHKKTDIQPLYAKDPNITLRTYG